jgi:hypothetical protein
LNTINAMFLHVFEEVVKVDESFGLSGAHIAQPHESLGSHIDVAAVHSSQMINNRLFGGSCGTPESTIAPVPYWISSFGAFDWNVMLLVQVLYQAVKVFELSTVSVWLGARIAIEQTDMRHIHVDAMLSPDMVQGGSFRPPSKCLTVDALDCHGREAICFVSLALLGLRLGPFFYGLISLAGRSSLLSPAS